MDDISAEHLAHHVSDQQQEICAHVASRLLSTFPELNRTLRLEDHYPPVARMADVAVRKLSDLVHAVLLFSQPSLAENELRWAQGVLPRCGVTYEHTTALIRWYFEDLCRLPLSLAERTTAYEIERYMLDMMAQIYHQPALSA